MPDIIYFGGGGEDESGGGSTGYPTIAGRRRTASVDCEVIQGTSARFMWRRRAMSANLGIAETISATATRNRSAVGNVAVDGLLQLSASGTATRNRSASLSATGIRQRVKAIARRNRAAALAGVHVVTPDTHYLEFIFDTPDQNRPFGAENGLIEEQPRLLYGPEDSDPSTWNEIKIGDWTCTEPRDNVSSEANFLLADPGDIVHFGPTTRFNFSVGQKIIGVWDEETMYTLIPYGEYRGSQQVISLENQAPGDNIRVTISSGLDNNLAKTAERDLIIFDPLREEVDESTLLPVEDSFGETYYPEVVQAYNLTLHTLFQKVLVERCGFEGFQTNIPNYPIKRYDCAMGASLYDALRPFIGMFNPVIYAEGSIIWIVDPDVTVPAGFPSARAWYPFQYKVYNAQTVNEKLDAILVQYLEEEADYDFTTYRNEPDEVVNLGDTIITIERRMIEFRKFAIPFVVLRDALDKETRTVTGLVRNALGQLVTDTISITVDDFTYIRGLINKRVKITRERLPDMALSSGSSIVYALQETERETETYTYRRHPFKLRQKYLARQSYRKTGLIIRDSENLQLSEEFDSLFARAWRSGNVYEGMAVRTGPVESRMETATPLRTGQVRVHVIEVDEIKGLVIRDYTETRAGDVGLGTSEGQKRVLVFEDETESPIRDTEKRIESLHIGEVPILIGIPLARRKLKARRLYGSSTLTLESVGIDRGFRRGSTASLRGRKDESDEYTLLGNFIILSRTFTGRGADISASYSLRRI